MVPKRLPYSNPEAVALLAFGVDHHTLTTTSDNDTVRRSNAQILWIGSGGRTFPSDRSTGIE